MLLGEGRGAQERCEESILGGVLPRVSVIMPTYNAGARIGAAISGVLCQTHSDVELIVVDDGSTDDTVEIVKGFGAAVRLLRQENAGPNAARNHGFGAATGEVIALCDSDDYLLPNYLSAALAVLAEAPPRTWVTCSSLSLTDNGLGDYGYSPFGEISRERQREAILQVNFVSIFSVFPRQLMEEVGPFNEELRRCEDWEYWARSILTGWRVAFQPEPASLYRQQGASQSSDGTAMLDAEDALFASLTARFAGTFTAAEEELLAARAELGSVGRQRAAARMAWARGDFKTAARALKQAAATYPVVPGLRLKALATGLLAPAAQALPESSGLRNRIQRRWAG